jgi:hypothetical protein
VAYESDRPEVYVDTFAEARNKIADFNRGRWIRRMESGWAGAIFLVAADVDFWVFQATGLSR